MSNSAPGFNDHPNYTVEITPLEGSLSVRVGDTVIAHSTKAVAVHESKHKPVWYMPLQDIDPQYIEATATQTYCPFKGYASYWRVQTGQTAIEDAVWAYMAPYDECMPLKEFASFYTNKVQVLIDDVPVDDSGPGWT